MKPNYFLKQAPFVRLLFPAILGISLAFWIDQWHWLIIVILALFLFASGVFWFHLKSQIKFQYDLVFGLMLLTQLSLISYTAAYFSFDKNMQNYVGDIETEIYCFQIRNQPTVKGQYVKCFAKALYALDTSWVKCQGNALLFLELSEELPKYGDVLIFKNRIQEVLPPKNPQDFNYKRYLNFKNINYQGFSKKDQWSLVKRDQGSKLMKLVYSVAQNVENRLFTFIQNDADQGIVAALILGNKSWLEPELLSNFSKTGTMHILAVSGLHVGIIYLLLMTVLAQLFPKSWLRIKLTILLILLWMFALLTGFSPSVSRACFMLSVVAIGESFQRSVSIYNTLAFSAFCVLLLNPMNLMQVGFQFSYLAVLGIVTLQKPIRNLFTTSSWLVDKVLSLTAVSCAAQLATLPLALYYFGQFPSYFLLSNIIVVPLVAIIVYGCVLVLAISWWPMIAKLVASLVSAYLWFMREVVGLIVRLPYSLLDSIYITMLEMCLIAVLIIFLSYLLIRKKRVHLHRVLFFAIAVLLVQDVRKYTIGKSSAFYFLDHGKYSQLFFRQGHEMHGLFSTDHNPNAGRYSVDPFYKALSISETKQIQLPTNADSSLRRVQFGELRIDIISAQNVGTYNADSSYSDVLWIQHVDDLTFDALPRRTKLVYLDSRLTSFEREKITHWCNQNEINVQQGYYSEVISK